MMEKTKIEVFLNDRYAGQMALEKSIRRDARTRAILARMGSYYITKVGALWFGSQSDWWRFFRFRSNNIDIYDIYTIYIYILYIYIYLCVNMQKKRYNIPLERFHTQRVHDET